MTKILFSPNGGCTLETCNQINKAEKSIQVLAYVFSSFEIAMALHSAAKRGVKVEIVVDSRGSNIQGSLIKDLSVNKDILIYSDHVHAIMHNKVMIIDSKIILTGSFNWTENAEHNNAENLIVLNNPDIVVYYQMNFLKHKEHSAPYNPNIRMAESDMIDITQF